MDRKVASKGVTGRDERRHRMSHGGAKSCHALEFVSTASRPACESRVWIGWMGLLAGCWWPITAQLTRARWGSSGQRERVAAGVCVKGKRVRVKWQKSRGKRMNTKTGETIRQRLAKPDQGKDRGQLT